MTRRHAEVVAGVDVGEVQRSLRDVQRRAVPPVPSEIRFKIKRIAMIITELLPRVGALGAGSPDTYVLVRCATDYLPDGTPGVPRSPPRLRRRLRRGRRQDASGLAVRTTRPPHDTDQIGSPIASTASTATSSSQTVASSARSSDRGRSTSTPAGLTPKGRKTKLCRR